MKILVLGGSGFIGSKLIAKLLSKDFDVSLIGRKKNARSPIFSDQVGYKGQLDFLDSERLFESIRRSEADYLVHVASGMLPLSEEQQFGRELSSLILPSFRLFEFCAKLGIKVLFFSSAGTIYGNNPRVVNEKSSREPINFYGYSKLLMEEHIFFLSRVAQLEFLILRPTNVYGREIESGRLQGLVEVVIDRLHSDEQINVWGTGGQKRDYLFVDDLVETVVGLLEKGVKNEVFNVGSGHEYSVLDVIEVVSALVGLTPRMVHQPLPENSIESLSIDTNKLRSLGELDFHTLEEGVASYLGLSG